MLKLYGNPLTTLRFEAFCCDNIDGFLNRNTSLEIEIVKRGSRSSSSSSLDTSNKELLQQIEDQNEKHVVSDETWRCDYRICWMKQLENKGILTVGELPCHSKPWPSMTEEDLSCYQDTPSCLYCQDSMLDTCEANINARMTSIGTILSPHYDGFNMYAKNLNCRWTIDGGHDNYIHVHFEMMQLIGSAQCTGDYLQISNVATNPLLLVHRSL